jgi:hypothetical protein
MATYRGVGVRSGTSAHEDTGSSRSFESQTPRCGDRRSPRQQPSNLAHERRDGTLRRRAQLELAARLEGRPGRGREAVVEARPQRGRVDRMGQVSVGHRDQLHLDTNPTGPAGRRECSVDGIVEFH